MLRAWFEHADSGGGVARSISLNAAVPPLRETGFHSPILLVVNLLPLLLHQAVVGQNTHKKSRLAT